jgi:hypothetical protein
MLRQELYFSGDKGHGWQRGFMIARCAASAAARKFGSLL